MRVVVVVVVVAVAAAAAAAAAAVVVVVIVVVAVAAAVVVGLVVVVVEVVVVVLDWRQVYYAFRCDSPHDRPLTLKTWEDSSNLTLSAHTTKTSTMQHTLNPVQTHLPQITQLTLFTL